MLSGIAADSGLSVIMINVNYEWGNISHFILIKMYNTLNLQTTMLKYIAV